MRLGIALAVVLALKLFIGLTLGGHPLLTPSGVTADLQGLDSDYYLHFAQRVRAGDVWLLDPASFFGQPAPAFFISPLYIYALALFLTIGGGSLAFARGAQLALGVAAVWLVMQTARRWYGDRAAWIAGALMAGCGLFTFYESLILQASLDPFLTALDLYTLTRALQDGPPARLGCCGRRARPPRAQPAECPDSCRGGDGGCGSDATLTRSRCAVAPAPCPVAPCPPSALSPCSPCAWHLSYCPPRSETIAPPASSSRFPPTAD